ncbi:SSI family serine proteinase inhibitor [Streptomyces sp. NPDC049040]|uniref:SSI family serine proteinase inhibitor n=1 Tax=Streptomyces sp. NPDC049040 TaxID=3365593 RepID=UPI0037195FC6
MKAILATVAATAAVLVPTSTQPAAQGLVLTAPGHTVTLFCEPFPHGTHPLAVPACMALSTAGGDFDALPGEPAVCREPYKPVVVTARGDFRGHPVRWRKKFANPCVLRAATGPVFAFAGVG